MPVIRITGGNNFFDRISCAGAGSYRGHKLVTHGGVISGFSSSVHHFVDDRITIIVLCNSKEGERRAGEDRMGQADALARDIADIYVPNLSKK